MSASMDQWASGPVDQYTVEDLLRDLPHAKPDADRAHRTRGRCHRRLTRPPLRRTVETVIVGGFCAAYLAIGAVLALTYRGLL